MDKDDAAYLAKLLAEKHRIAMRMYQQKLDNLCGEFGTRISVKADRVYLDNPLLENWQNRYCHQSEEGRTMLLEFRVVNPNYNPHKDNLNDKL